MTPGSGSSGSTTIRVGLTPESKALIAKRRDRVLILQRNLRGALEQGLAETDSRLKFSFLRGGDPFARRGGVPPLAVRSGALLGSITHAVDQPPYSGVVGSGEGAASKYARIQLDDKAVTITPRSAKHLWIPTRSNMTGGGQMKMSPREAMGLTDERGKRRLRIFGRKGGPLVAFLPDARGGRYARGKNKGKERGAVLFTLVKSVIVKGSGSLAKAVDLMRPRFAALLQGAVTSALAPQEGGDA